MVPGFGSPGRMTGETSTSFQTSESGPASTATAHPSSLERFAPCGRPCCRGSPADCGNSPSRRRPTSDWRRLWPARGTRFWPRIAFSPRRSRGRVSISCAALSQSGARRFKIRIFRLAEVQRRAAGRDPTSLELSSRGACPVLDLCFQLPPMVVIREVAVEIGWGAGAGIPSNSAAHDSRPALWAVAALPRVAMGADTARLRRRAEPRGDDLPGGRGLTRAGGQESAAPSGRRTRRQVRAMS